MPSRGSSDAGDYYCLIGGDVSSSPSPAMMNSAFSELSIHARYAALSIEAGDLARRFAQLRQDQTKGLNVTIPFKSAIIPLLEGLDRVSTKIGAVNTVRREGAKLVGHNTDVDGIIRPLQKGSSTGKAEDAVVIGAGGAARAFVEALDRLGCERITVLVRDKSRASGFAKDMESKYGRMEISLLSISESDGLPSSIPLLFNASPIGSRNIPLPDALRELARRASTVFDAVYLPILTELLSTAERAGAHIVYGHEMLLHQGAAAFELWTGAKAPLEVMKKHLLLSLGGGS